MTKAKEFNVDLYAFKATLLKRSFYRFVQEFWDVNIPEEPVWNWHIKELCDELQEVIERVIRREKKLEDVICNIPPGTTKSTIFSQMLPAWAWAVDPTMRIGVFSYSESLASGHTLKARNIINSDKYKKYFPGIKLSPDKNTKTDYANTSNGQIACAGLSGTITGIHFHIIIIDDPMNPTQALSKAEYKATNETVDNTLSTRKVDKKVTVTLLVMQRLSENDTTAHLLGKSKKIKHICLPAELRDGVKPAKYEAFYKDGLLDPIRLSPDVLAEQLVDLGPTNYAGQFSQKPAPAKGKIWQRWFIEVDDNLWPTRKQFRQYGFDWDTAFTDDEENAASAYVAGGKIGNDIYIDALDFDWLEFPEMVKWMKRLEGPHYIENKANGRDLKTTLTRDGVNAVLVNVEGGKDKEARAEMASVPAEAGRVYIRKSLAAKLYDDAKQGILKFPRGKYKDLADALAQFIIRLNKKEKSIVSSNTTSSEGLLGGLHFDD